MRGRQAPLLIACLLLGTLGGAPARGSMSSSATGDEGAVRFKNFATGFSGGEPTVAVTEDGAILTVALTSTIRSTDSGREWVEVHVPPSGETTLDPYIHIDEETQRIWSSQLLGACQMLSVSDDGGASWLDVPTQCPSGDHQKLGSGPWADDLPHAYPRAVYTCVNKVGDTACSVSPDGGLTWPPPTTVFLGYDPTASNGVNGVAGLCGGLEGDPVSGPEGNIYLPREYCGRPYLGVSKDNGLTWSTHHVAAPAEAGPIAWGGNNPAVSADSKGNIYYAWTGMDWRHYVARSTDEGVTWSKPWEVMPQVRSSTFPYVIAGKKGAVATAFVGTRDTKKGPDLAPKKTKWYLFVAYSFDATAKSPHWKTIQVTDHPVQIGCIGRHGVSCGNGNLLDFIDMGFDPEGRLNISYADGCIDKCVKAEDSNSSLVTIARQTRGPSFR